MRDGLPMCPPIDSNDLMVIAQVGTIKGSDVPHPPAMCGTRGFGTCQKDNLWRPCESGQTRHCTTCRTFFHHDCLRQKCIRMPEEMMADPEFFQATQRYFAYLGSQGRSRQLLPTPHIAWGESAVDRDIDDGQNLVPLPVTTWAEVACIPLARYTQPGRAVLTLEVVIMEARNRVERGQGSFNLTYQDVLDLKAAHPQAGMRAIKYLLTLFLNKLRSDGFVYYSCPLCLVDVI
ncbi:hypothetical protein GGG16DRAFT_106379 [Schizophyllum commune]